METEKTINQAGAASNAAMRSLLEEVLTSQQGGSTITTSRFRIPLPSDEYAAMLATAYRSEVERRGRRLEDVGHVIDHVEQLAGIMTGSGPIDGVAMIGGCGNGKTTLMTAFASVWARLYRCGMFEGVTTRWFKPRMTIVCAIDIANAARDPRQFDDLRRLPMLGIDDLGTEPADLMDYGNVLNPIARLIEKRYEEQLFTMVTTNMAPGDIRPRYKDRVADRFNEMFHRIYFRNETYRHRP